MTSAVPKHDHIRDLLDMANSQVEGEYARPADNELRFLQALASLKTEQETHTFPSMTREEIEAKIAAAEARTDAKFVEMMGELKASRAEFTGAMQASHATLLGEIKAVGERVAGVEGTLSARMGAVERATAGTKTTIIITGIAIFAAVVAAIAWGGDEFGRGSEMGQLIDSRIDAKLDHLIEVLRVPNNVPTPQQ